MKIGKIRTERNEYKIESKRIRKNQEHEKKKCDRHMEFCKTTHTHTNKKREEKYCIESLHTIIR